MKRYGEPSNQNLRTAARSGDRSGYAASVATAVVSVVFKRGQSGRGRVAQELTDLANVLRGASLDAAASIAGAAAAAVVAD